jgi:hypothetical protein
MTSPWKRHGTPDAQRTYLALASSIPAKRVTDAGKMFRGSRQVRKQLAGAQGLIGFSLLARPFKKQYATLSVWESEDALQAFVHENPHEGLMGEIGPLLAAAKFVRWETSGAEAHPSWHDALVRLGID